MYIAKVQNGVSEVILRIEFHMIKFSHFNKKNYNLAIVWMAKINNIQPFFIDLSMVCIVFNDSFFA